jgi:3-hydroxybutyryl-CoA dehydrogenase
MTHHVESAMVIGAGTMGAGIAEVLAKATIKTFLFDVNEEAVAAGLDRVRTSLAKAVAREKITDEARKAILDRITTTTEQADSSKVDLVIEAAPENLELKQRIFKGISENNADAILASNTSSLSIKAIASEVAGPQRVIGLHFFNPVPIMPLLEIVQAEDTSDEVVRRCRALAENMKKNAIVVKDSPGFASSRLGLVLGLEAMRMLEAGVASAQDIDKAMELGYRHPMGPLKLTDLVGLDVRLAIAEHLAKEIGPQFEVPAILRRLVQQGKLGQKTKEGFYRWDGKNAVPKDLEC